MNSVDDIKLLQNKRIRPLIYLLFFLSSSLPLFAQQPKHFFKTDFSTRTGFGSANSVGIGNHLSQIGLTITDDTNVFSMRIEPVYGRFLSPHWLLGSGLIAEINNSEFLDDVIASERLTIYPFARYYFKPLTRTVKYQFFVEGSYSRFFVLKRPQFNRFEASTGLGVTRFMNNSIALDTRLIFVKDQFRNWGEGRLQADATLNIFLDNRTQNRSDLQQKTRSGNWMLGVSDLFFSVAGENGRQIRNVQIQSDILHFIADRLAAGVGMRWGWSRRSISVRTPSDSFFARATVMNLGLQPQLRYYFSTEQHVMLFVTTGVGISYQIEILDQQLRELLNRDDPTEFIATDVGFGLGANIFLTPDIAFEFGPNVQFGLDQKRMRFGIDTGVSCFLGTKERSKN